MTKFLKDLIGQVLYKFTVQPLYLGRSEQFGVGGNNCILLRWTANVKILQLLYNTGFELFF